MGLSQSNSSTLTCRPLSIFPASLTCSVLARPNSQTGWSTYGMGSSPPSTPTPSSAYPQVSQRPHHLSLTCVFPADIRCHSCYKVPVLGCVDRQSCRLEPGQQCLTTHAYLGNIPFLSGVSREVGDSTTRTEVQMGLRLRWRSRGL